MLTLSFVINILIVAPLTWLMLRGAVAMDASFGPDTSARRILACLYGTIGVASGVGLWLLASGQANLAEALAWTLLPMQIVYKLGTWPAVGFQSPVVRTNLGVVVLHSATLVTLL